MPTSTAPAPSAAQVLRDAWPRARPVLLDGVAEQRGTPLLVAAAVAFVVAWVLFQLIGGVVTGVGIVAAVLGEGGDPATIGDAADQMARFPGVALFGNTVGQALGLGGVAWWAVRRHTRSGKAAFLRLRRPDLPGLGLSVLGWAVGLPCLLWLGDVNASLPLPEWLDALEQLQTDLLDGLLHGDRIGMGWLLLALAVTPALCEELLFRGFLQRQVERRWGAAASVVLVGVVFGLFHLRLTQFLPLAALGVYLGFAVWATGSLWTGSLLHVLHNAAMILVATEVLHWGGEAALSALNVPLWLAVGSASVVAAVGWALRRRHERVTGGGRDAVVTELPLYDNPPATVRYGEEPARSTAP